jgi:DNA polymerase-3 subunit delta
MDSVYLICSDSIRLLDDKIKEIVGENPYDTFDLNNCSLEDIIEEANYFSLFDDKKYIVVKNSIIFTSPKKKDEEDDSVSKKDEILLRYLESPNYNTILIFTLNGKANGTKKIVKTIKDRYNYIEIGNLKVRDLYDKVDTLLKSKGYKADKNAIYYIINNSLNNYDLAYNEVEKIDLYYKRGRSLTIDDVTNIVSRVMEDNNFKFIDAVMSRNVKEIFKIYDDLMLQKVEPLMLLAMIAKELRNSLLVKLMDGNKNEMMKTLGVKYEFQLEKWLNYSYTFTDVFLENKLIELADLNYKIKSGKVSSKLGLQLFLLDFCK